MATLLDKPPIAPVKLKDWGHNLKKISWTNPDVKEKNFAGSNGKGTQCQGDCSQSPEPGIKLK